MWILSEVHRSNCFWVNFICEKGVKNWAGYVMLQLFFQPENQIWKWYLLFIFCAVWWFIRFLCQIGIPIIPALEKQEDQDFLSSLGYVGKPCQRINKKKPRKVNNAPCHSIKGPGTMDALLESRGASQLCFWSSVCWEEQKQGLPLHSANLLGIKPHKIYNSRIHMWQSCKAN